MTIRSVKLETSKPAFSGACCTEISDSRTIVVSTVVTTIESEPKTDESRPTPPTQTSSSTETTSSESDSTSSTSSSTSSTSTSSISLSTVDSRTATSSDRSLTESPEDLTRSRASKTATATRATPSKGKGALNEGAQDGNHGVKEEAKAPVGMIIGIVVGVVAVLVIAMVFSAWYRRRKRRGDLHEAETSALAAPPAEYDDNGPMTGCATPSTVGGDQGSPKWLDQPMMPALPVAYMKERPSSKVPVTTAPAVPAKTSQDGLPMPVPRNPPLASIEMSGSRTFSRPTSEVVLHTSEDGSGSPMGWDGRGLHGRKAPPRHNSYASTKYEHLAEPEGRTHYSYI